MFRHFIASMKTKYFQAVATTGVLCCKQQSFDNEFTWCSFIDTFVIISTSSYIEIGSIVDQISG